MAYVGVSTKCPPDVGRTSVGRGRFGVGPRHVGRMTHTGVGIGRMSADRQSDVGRLSVDCRSIFGRRLSLNHMGGVSPRYIT